MIVRYAIRSVIALGASSLVTVAIIAVMTGIITVLSGLGAGLHELFEDSGDPSTAVVLKGTSEVESIVTPAQASRLSTLPGVQSGAGGRALLSLEAVRDLPYVDGKKMTAARLRGGDPIALEVRPDVHVRGRLPAHLEPEVAVGERFLEMHPDLHVGSTAHIGRHAWTVVGVIESNHSTAANELWLDRAFLKQTLRTDHDNAVYVRLSGAVGPFADAVNAMRGEHLVAMTERAFLQRQIASVSLYFDAVDIVLALLVVVMTLVSANTIYTSFLGRTRELGTLMAIGFTRRRVMLIIATESLFLTAVGVALGIALALPAHGHHVVLEAQGLVYDIHITARVLLRSLLVGASSGFAASAAALIQTARVNVLGALRE